MAALGIDTSCYTTSVALSQDGEVAADLRKKLEVEEGGLGLRQSEALYNHIRNLPDLVDRAFTVARRSGIVVDSVAVSSWPRRVEGSYMPVFNAGRSLASAVAIFLAKKMRGDPPTADDVDDAVERVLIEMGHGRTALVYARYRDRRARVRRLRAGDASPLLNEVAEAQRESAFAPRRASVFVRTSAEKLA
ncbi:MAG TPA: hypothetical protein PLI10_04120, partial [Bacillota bacterium]|nr:hypothetical protein [Bacillota bacterium]